MHDERPLSGGNLTGVVQVGDTVRRTCGPWSRTVQDLLRHLERVDFAGAPRFYGLDEQGREILTFLPGEVGVFPYIWAEGSVVQAARLLRQLHDATAAYQPPPDAHWQLVYPDPSQHEVICHNDFAPYNLVFVDQRPLAIIDFDTAGPGPRLWDIAYAVYWFVPLFLNDVPEAPGLHDLRRASARLRLFCDAYGIPATPDLLDLVGQRLHALCIHMITRAFQGERAYRTMIDEGHLAGYQHAIQTLRQSRAALAQHLLEG
jgi:Phosphotransferase enzyme family